MKQKVNPSRPKLKKTTVYLGEKQVQRLDELSRVEGVTVAELIRNSITLFLNDKKPVATKFAYDELLRSL